MLDSTLIQTILPIINNDNFSLEYLQNIKEDELVEMIKSVGIQHKHAKDLKIAIDQIAKEFGGKIPGTEKELHDIHGVGQKTGLLILEEVFNKVEVSLPGTNIFICNICLIVLHLSRASWLTFM